MRFRLTLAVDREKNKEALLPINYQYEVSSWIFHTLNNADNEFAHWLHSTGYCNQNRKFKLFTFSRLSPDKYSVSGDRLRIESSHVFLTVSFFIPDAVEHFITGCFKKQQIKLGDNISSIDFVVQQIEKLQDISFSTSMRFRTISPLIISKNINDEKYARYLSPEEGTYSDLLYNNLISKYVALAELKYADCDKAVVSNHQEFGFSLLGGVRQKLIKIKSGKTSQTFLKGFEYDFRLTAPVELMRIGYYGGFGEKNSLGFGCCQVIT